MLSKTVKYQDFDGNDVETTFWFHLDKDELIRLNFGQGEVPLSEAVATIGDSNTDILMVLDLLKSIVAKSVGVRSEDGKFFDKEDKSAYRELMMTDAYSELTEALLSDPKEANAFIYGIMPKNVQGKVGDTLGPDAKFDELTPEQMRDKLRALEASQKREENLKAVQSNQS